MGKNHASQYANFGSLPITIIFSIKMINTPRKNSKYYNISSSLEILLFLYFPGIQNKIIAKNMQIALFFTISLSYLYQLII